VTASMLPARFCIPFTLATTLGLSALALDLPITALESNQGLVPPAAAFFLLGKFGGILMTVMLLMCALPSPYFFPYCTPPHTHTLTAPHPISSSSFFK